MQVGDAFCCHGDIVFEFTEGAVKRVERSIGRLASHFILVLQVSQPVHAAFIRPALQFEPNLLRMMITGSKPQGEDCSNLVNVILSGEVEQYGATGRKIQRQGPRI
jgi:hypothetical protein